MTHNHHLITTRLAAALALSAIAAPTASARFELKPPAGAQNASPAVRPNPDQQTSQTPVSPVSCGDVCSGHGYGPVNVPTQTATATAGPRPEVHSGGGSGSANVPSTVVRVSAPTGGFDWGAAGIGAGGGLALAVIAIGGTLAVRNHPPARTTRRPPATHA
jgi:hypothetical protein